MTYVCLERGVAFVHIPRAGGTSILEALREVGGGMPLESHLRARDLRGRLGPETWDGLHSIAVVREPLEWFWSNVRFIRSEPLHRLFVAALTTDIGEICRLASVVTLIGGRQVDFLCDLDGTPLVRHVLRFERLAEDWAELAATLSLPESLPHRNARPAPDESPFSTDDRRRVLAVSAEDAIRLDFDRAGEALEIVDDAWRGIAALGSDWSRRPEACRTCAEILVGLGEFDGARCCAALAGDCGFSASLPSRFGQGEPNPEDVRAFVDRIVSSRAREPLVSAASRR